MTTYAIQTSALGRHYAVKGKEPLRALQDVTLTIRPGETRGLLGPNGAGKTTLVKILSTALLPTSGQAFVAGYDVVRHTALVRRRVSVVFGGDKGLFANLTARENLLYWGALYGLSKALGCQRTHQLLEELGLADRADDRVGSFSRGLKQRVHLARGLVPDPDILFLDEPTAGMDPVAARMFRDSIAGLQRRGKTILLTTHDMAEAAALCDSVSFINKGTLIRTEAPSELSSLLTRGRRLEFSTGDTALVETLGRMPGISSVVAVEGHDGRFRAEVSDDLDLPTAVALLLSKGVRGFTFGDPTLEEAYMKLMS